MFPRAWRVPEASAEEDAGAGSVSTLSAEEAERNLRGLLAILPSARVGFAGRGVP